MASTRGVKDEKRRLRAVRPRKGGRAVGGIASPRAGLFAGKGEGKGREGGRKEGRVSGRDGGRQEGRRRSGEGGWGGTEQQKQEEEGEEEGEEAERESAGTDCLSLLLPHCPPAGSMVTNSDANRR